MNAWPTVTAWLVDFDSWWILPLVGLAVLNVWQYAKYHDVKGKLSHVFEHGHEPEGKVLVPAAAVAVAEPPVLTKSQAVDVDDWADGTWPAGHVPAADELKHGRAVPAKSQFDPAALAAARSYRVAVGLYGPDDPRTMTFVPLLASHPNFSEVLAYAGDAGYDKAAEDKIRAQLKGL